MYKKKPKKKLTKAQREALKKGQAALRQYNESKRKQKGDK